MTDRTCDACEWWVPPVSDKVIGECMHTKFSKNYYDMDEEMLPDGARIMDDCGRGFLTAPKFGCVHWEAKGE